MKKYFLLLLLIPTIYPMKHSPSTEDVNALEVKASLYDNIRLTLLKIDPLKIKSLDDPQSLLLNVALELNNDLLNHKRIEIPEVAFFFAVTKTQTSKEILVLLLKACSLDPINTLKVSQVITNCLKRIS